MEAAACLTSFALMSLPSRRPVCPAGSTPSSLCPTSPPPPPPRPAQTISKRSAIALYAILGIVLGGVAALVVVASIALYMVNRRRAPMVQRMEVTPQPAADVAAPGTPHHRQAWRSIVVPMGSVPVP